MDILQDTVAFVRYIDTQIFLVFLFPENIQLGEIGLSGEDLLFQFITDQDVDRISQFISVRPDQRTLRNVDRFDKLFQCHIAEIFREDLLQFRIESLPEGFPSA